MSVPFFTRKDYARSYYGKLILEKDPLVKAYVPASRGFLQASKSGFYYMTKSQAKKLKLTQIKIV